MRLSIGLGCMADYFKFSAMKSNESEGDWLEARKLEGVKNKMKLGRKLSFDDKVLLKIRAQDLYEKAIQIEEERDEFRKALSNCKTKQEAQALKTSKSDELQTEAKSNGNLEFTNMRIMAVLNEFSCFTKGGGQ